MSKLPTKRDKKRHTKDPSRICPVCGGFEEKCQKFGHIPTRKPKRDVIVERPEEDPGWGWGV